MTQWQDAVYGKMRFQNAELKDAIILKSDGYPVYNFANVVDDHEMRITHVTRGEEFLSSTPIHIQLYRALGWSPPEFVHLPLILDEQRKKLSKRVGDVMVDEFLKKGYLKPALLNFIALLGWNPKTTREIFSLEELIEEFDIKKINKAGAIFDLTKLDFINSEWVRRLNLRRPEDNPMFDYVVNFRQTLLSKMVSPADIRVSTIIAWSYILERLSGPSQVENIVPEFNFLDVLNDYDPRLLLWKNMPFDRAKQNLEMLRDFISTIKTVDFKKVYLEETIKRFLTAKKVPFGEGLWPLRVALSGLKNSLSPFEIMEFLAAHPSYGVKQILERINKAIRLLDQLAHNHGGD